MKNKVDIYNECGYDIKDASINEDCNALTETFFPSIFLYYAILAEAIKYAQFFLSEYLQLRHFYLFNYWFFSDKIGTC